MFLVVAETAEEARAIVIENWVVGARLVGFGDSLLSEAKALEIPYRGMGKA